jgi:hypothetical protein
VTLAPAPPGSAARGAPSPRRRPRPGEGVLCGPVLSRRSGRAEGRGPDLVTVRAPLIAAPPTRLGAGPAGRGAVGWETAGKLDQPDAAACVHSSAFALKKSSVFRDGALPFAPLLTAWGARARPRTPARRAAGGAQPLGVALPRPLPLSQASPPFGAAASPAADRARPHLLRPPRWVAFTASHGAAAGAAVQAGAASHALLLLASCATAAGSTRTAARSLVGRPAGRGNERRRGEEGAASGGWQPGRGLRSGVWRGAP